MLARLFVCCTALTLNTPLFAQNAEPEQGQIIVTGNREAEAEATADTAQLITLRQPASKPLPRHYEPACIKIFGIDPEYADVIAQRMRDNIGALNIPLAGKDCAPTIWVGFVPDSYKSVAKLRKSDRSLFGDMRGDEIDRMLSGNKAAQAWFAREDKGIDGKPFSYRTIELNGVEISVKHNDQWNAGRISGTIRVDMAGSIVLFDNTLSAGRTVRQLADYATFRALAPVRDISADQSGIPSILSLFANGGMPPSGLTEFDWSYLAAYYKLDEGAKAPAVHDAAKRAFLQGEGLKLSEKTGYAASE